MEPNDTMSAAPVESAPPAAPAPAAPAPPAEPPTGAPAPSVAAAAPTRRRPRGRTALIITAAALLGISGGVAVGYGIQAERPPTPLPALSQPGLGYPAKPLPSAPAPLPAAQDRQVTADGDLRELLVDRPKGAKKLGGGDGWETLSEYTQGFYDEPNYMFETLAGSDFRRVASVEWRRGQFGGTGVELIQFRSGDTLAASDHLAGQLEYMDEEEDGAGNPGHPIKGSGEGRYFLYPVERKAGYLPSYRARALAVRGDIVMDINVFDTAPIKAKDIRTLAERQLERL
ncbi:hypothetical protein RM717_09835 [Streptomyces griseus]|uniref:Serine/threonine protein kinase n=1 Tax=Streptomyces stephensoniae TaxID=3375367 RepID=A0ABU2VYY8_9ACTN|nr:hypothetical protein [Streptomyces griseus]MDT0490805.1 hypothetical protein [Streptomyces griseus]